MAKTNDNDPHEVDIDADLDAEEISEQARGTFSFDDRLNEVKHRHAKIMLFTDMEAVDEYHQINARTQAMVDSAGRIDLKSPGGLERHEALLAEHEKLETQLEDARALMLKSALSVHLHAWPNIALKVAKKEARKKYHDKVLGGVPESLQEEAGEYVDMQLLGASIVKIVDSTGAVDDLAAYTVGTGKKQKTIKPRETIGKKMSEKLPPSQWQRLYDSYQVLTLTDQIGSAATDDAGF